MKRASRVLLDGSFDNLVLPGLAARAVSAKCIFSRYIETRDYCQLIVNLSPLNTNHVANLDKRAIEQVARVTVADQEQCRALTR